MPRTAVLAAVAALATLVPAAASAAATIHEHTPDGRTLVRQVSSLPPADPIPPAAVTAATQRETKRLAARAAQARKTFAQTVEELFAAGQIDQLQYDAARGAAADMRSLIRKVPAGARQNNLKDVLGLADALAGRNQLSAGRVPVVTEILARNAEYWNDGALLSYGARVDFTGSRIVWQYYPGAGLQPQWLGTFGFANIKAASKSMKKSVIADLTGTLDEALALASPRAGGIAWESFFTFSGSPPPWVSALSQGTAIQALSRASAKLARPDYLEAATASLGIFETAPPEGVALPEKVGTHYLIYSGNSKLLVLNGFIQSLNGLWDYATISQNPEGLALFQAGDAQAQAEIPKYDTGAWSLYEGLYESSVSYHQLLRDFLANLCERTTTALYCDTAARFTADETTPPSMRIVTSKGTPGKSVPVRFTLSKKSSVSLYVDDVPITSATLPYGTQTLSWAGQKKAGKVTVTLKARDLSGNTAEVSKIITLKRG